MAKNPAGEVKTNKVQFKLTIMSYVIIEGRGRVRETMKSMLFYIYNKMSFIIISVAYIFV
jgi:hypothetical protein